MTYGDFQKLEQPSAPRTLAYGADTLQYVELWRPQGPGPFPVAIMLHGGCWQSEVAKADIMHRLAETLVRRGVAVWNVEYRGVDVPGGGYPGTFADVAAAADLLAARASELGLDRDRTVAVGHSAGGHLALWLAARSKISADSALHAEAGAPLRGVISLAGLPDLEVVKTEAAQACGADTVEKLVGSVTPARPLPYADTSPVRLLPLGIRQVLLSAAADTIAPPRFADAYAAKARSRGDAVTDETIANQGHFELITPGTPAGDAAVAAVVEMVR